ncbi:MAG TPA: tripartite tricarboxylate transporter substrate-binding protein [Burkholderiales bacterium]|nr:tripartite tricarboxylate transporter substrate-binding protein [Burkholderiales bacterium]
MRQLARLFVILAAALAGLPAAAQQYPVKPVRVIVSTVPGPLDAFTRILFEKVAAELKQPFVIENRPGAGGNLAAELIAKAPPDGYTLLSAIDTTFTVNPSLYKKLPFDPAKDFATISVPVTYGQMLAVHPSVPANSVAELVTLAKQKRLTYASGGNGTPSHLTYAYFLATAGVDMTHVPYKGTGQSVVDVVGGQVDTIFAVVTGVLPQVKGGKLRALGVSSPQRSGLAPEVPTIAESGFAGFDASFAYAVMAPAGTPEEIVQILNRAIRRALASPDVQEKNRLADYLVTDLDARQSADWLKDNRERWAKVIARAGISAD